MKISKEFKTNYLDVRWKEMSGMRDKLIHDYLGVDVEVVWKTVEINIPVLEKLLIKID